MKVIPVGRIFVHRLIDASTKVQRLHHIKTTAQMWADINWWLHLASDRHGKCVFIEVLLH